MENTNIILFDKQYIKYKNKLENLEKDRFFCKHSLEHFLDVARICYILSLENNIKVSKDMIYSTALLHDLGRVIEIEEGVSHEIASVDLARDILSRTKFSKEEVERILACIASHRNKDSKDDFFEIFYRADKLSRLCFNCKAYKECNWSYEKKNHEIKY